MLELKTSIPARMCLNAICLSVGLPTSHSLIPFKTLIKRDSDLRSLCCLVLVNTCLLQIVESFSFSVKWAEEINYFEHPGKSFLNFSTPYTCQIITAPKPKRKREKSQDLGQSLPKQTTNRKKCRCLSHPPKVSNAHGQQRSDPPPNSILNPRTMQLSMVSEGWPEPQTLGG